MITVLENIINTFENQRFIEKNINRDRGVIYTPQPVADFMVKNVFNFFFYEFPEIQNIIRTNSDFTGIKELLTKNKNLKEKFELKIRNIKILDPACGTGRFLIAISKFLFKIYKTFEFEVIDQTLKKEIIKTHLYGIEIDKSALNISKIRLISWIYSDDYPQFSGVSINSSSKLDEIEHIITRFDLKFNFFNLDYLLEFNLKEFSIIIGNPPYVENKKILDADFKKRIKDNFETAYGLYDLSIVFIEKSIEILKNKSGYLSFLTTNKFLSADYGLKIRKLLLESTAIKEIINISSLPIFHRTAAYPVIFTIQKRSGTNNAVTIKEYEVAEGFTLQNEKITEFLQESIKNLPSSVIPLSNNIKLVDDLYSNFKQMKDVIKDLRILYRPFGFINWADNFKNIRKNKTSNKDLLLIGTGNVGKYYIDFEKHIKIAKKDQEITYFKFHPEYEYIWDSLSHEKLALREIAKSITCVYDPGIYANLTGLYFLIIPSFNTNDYFCLLTLLNSSLIDVVFKTLYGTLHMSGGYLRFNGSFIRSLPIPEKFPLTISYIGKILQFLSQLRHNDLLGLINQQKSGAPFHNSLKYLKFYEELSNSLVKQLYLNLENCSELDLLLTNQHLIADIKIKFMNSLYDLPKYVSYSHGEFEDVFSQICKNFENLNDNAKLVNQMKYILEKQL